LENKAIMIKSNIIKVLRNATVIGACLAIFTGCERDLSDDAILAPFPNIADIYTDNPVNLTDEFFISFDPAVGANTEAFGTDDDVSYVGTSSIRLDVPADNDPNGTFVGGIFRDRGAGRNLTQYNVLSFWAKASRTATFGPFGYGVDFEGNQFAASRFEAELSTDWRKYIVPFPDPSKLTQESGMFVFAAGTQSTGGAGYVIWIDELRFENLGTVAQLRPRIFSGEDRVETGFIGGASQVAGLGAIFNGPDGVDIDMEPAPAYFEFASSDPGVASVDEQGSIEIIGVGEATITAVLNGVQAAGSLTLQVEGEFVSAPVPPSRDPGDVISIYSDAYDGVTGLNLAVFNNPEIQIEEFTFNDDSAVSYRNLSFVGQGWDGTSNVSGMDFLHVDIQVSQSFNPNTDSVVVELIDFGANGVDGGGDDTGGGFRVQGTQLQQDQWVGIDIPVTGFNLPTGGGFQGSPNLNNIARVVFVGGGISNIIVDNVYFYRD
jgi:hypothetical protein